jgi:hypothetical protein
MKQLKSLMIPFALTILVQCNKDNGCIEHEAYRCHLIDISDEYNPVCGCDGTTYKNAGFAQCDGGITKYREGECN